MTDNGGGVSIDVTTTGTVVGIPSNDNVVEGNSIPESGGPAIEVVSSIGNELIDNIGTDSNGEAIELYNAQRDPDQGQRRPRQQGRHLAQGLERQPHRGQRRERVGRHGHRARGAVALERPPEQHLLEQHRRRHLRRRRDRRGLRDAHRRQHDEQQQGHRHLRPQGQPRLQEQRGDGQRDAGASGRARARTAASTSTAAATSPRATTARSAST